MVFPFLLLSLCSLFTLDLLDDLAASTPVVFQYFRFPHCSVWLPGPFYLIDDLVLNYNIFLLDHLAFCLTLSR